MKKKINLHKNIISENGSIALFVLLSLLFFLVVVTSVGISMKNKQEAVEKEEQVIKNNYEKDVGNEENVYNEKMNSINPGI